MQAIKDYKNEVVDSAYTTCLRRALKSSFADIHNTQVHPDLSSLAAKHPLLLQPTDAEVSGKAGDRSQVQHTATEESQGGKAIKSLRDSDTFKAFHADGSHILQRPIVPLLQRRSSGAESLPEMKQVLFSYLGTVSALTFA